MNFAAEKIMRALTAEKSQKKNVNASRKSINFVCVGAFFSDHISSLLMD